MSIISRYLQASLVERLNHLQLSARRVVEGSTIGQHRSPLRGASVEFRQHRIYAPGDEPRRLDWRVFGRTDRPYIREYDEETNLRCMLMLDCSGSMAYGRDERCKFDYAARLAAALAYLMLAQTESVGLGTIGEAPHWIAPRSGKGQLSRLIEQLERVRPAGAPSMGAAMHEAAQRLGRRALVVVISDLLAPVSPLRRGVAHLRHDGHEVILMRVVHRDELAFPFRSWIRLRGLEGEPAAMCDPSLARKTYQENFARHRAELEQSCRTLGAELSVFITDTLLDEALIGFLRSRM